ncbi:MAG: hypothetical protein JXO44_10325 [Clostridia bacterium]|nr:hypothetical protein [Clostridia bacterium]
MKIIERLNLELSNKEYFTAEQYTVFLTENELNANDEYIKATHQSKLLYTVIDILEAVSNDIEVLRKVETEFLTTESAYKHLQDRIGKIKQRIYDITADDNDSNISLLFSRA